MENPYANSKTLVLKEVMPDAVYRSLLSKNLTTTTTQFNAVLGDGASSSSADAAAQRAAEDANVTGVPSSSADTANNGGSSSSQQTSAAGGGIKGAYVIKTAIKSPSALLSDVDAESSLGLTAADALAALFPPEPVSSGASHHQFTATTPPPPPMMGDDGTTVGGAAAAANNSAMVAVARIDHADRMDVINLQERVLQLLEEGRARPAGICPVREGVYDAALAEITRQVAVLCPERGLLLSELRREMGETDTTYDLLFDAACQYAVRKAISRDLGRTMLQEMEDMAAEVRTAENRVAELRAKYEGQQKRAVETRAAAQRVHEEEVAFIKKGTAQLTQEIKRLTLQQQQQQQR